MKYLLVLILGFCLHKGLEEVHDYYWYRGFSSELCKGQYMKDADSGVDKPLTKRFQCTQRHMGIAAKLNYILLRPHWSDDTGERWYY